MIELSKENFSIELNKKNPLHLNESYENNLYAFKTLLSSSYMLNEKNDNIIMEFRKLGYQIVDSFKLLSILNKSTYIKKSVKYYDELIKSLYNTINKYSKFEKMLRNYEFFTPIFLSDRYLFNKDIKENQFDIVSEVNRAVNSKNSYLIYNKYLNETDEGYSLNDILNSTDLFRKLIAKDKDLKFKYLMEKKNRNVNTFSYSKDLKKLINKKNIILKQIMDSSDSSDIDNNYIDNINIKFKKLFVTELNICILDDLLNSLLYDFELEPNVYELYKLLKLECEELLSRYINDDLILCNQLDKELDSFLELNSNAEVKNNYILSSEMNQLRTYYMRNYMAEKIKGSEMGKLSFVKYLQLLITNDNGLIEFEKHQNEIAIEAYSEYIVYLAGQDDKNSALSFEEFTNLKYGNKKINITTFENNEESYKIAA